MKYVRSISLFFVYPLLCFAIGLLMGEALQEKKMSKVEDQRVEENMPDAAPPVILYDGGDAASAEEEPAVQDQDVMNSSVISQAEMENSLPEGAESVREGYFVALYNDYVVVYHSDRSTIYLFTDMKSEELPAEVQGDLADGIYMKDEGELYDFLENYTS